MRLRKRDLWGTFWDERAVSSGEAVFQLPMTHARPGVRQRQGGSLGVRPLEIRGVKVGQVPVLVQNLIAIELQAFMK